MDALSHRVVNKLELLFFQGAFSRNRAIPQQCMTGFEYQAIVLVTTDFARFDQGGSNS